MRVKNDVEKVSIFRKYNQFPHNESQSENTIAAQNTVQLYSTLPTTK